MGEKQRKEWAQAPTQPVEVGWFALPADYGLHLPGLFWNETHEALALFETLFGVRPPHVLRLSESAVKIGFRRAGYEPGIRTDRALDPKHYIPGYNPEVWALKHRWIIRLPWGYFRVIQNESARRMRIDPATGQRYYK